MGHMLSELCALAYWQKGDERKWEKRRKNVDNYKGWLVSSGSIMGG
jgi:hypothetical protein